jgi:hypothetical protein
MSGLAPFSAESAQIADEAFFIWPATQWTIPMATRHYRGFVVG